MTLELRNVVKQVGAETHIHETSVQLAEDGFNILLGTTLSGKTTLMQLMAGLERPTAGEIWFDGKDVTGVAVQKRNVSMVYQQFINYPNFSVFENIASPLRVARMQQSKINDRVHRMAELLRLTPMLDRRPAELSGGQQQRTALARALVKDATSGPARRAVRQSRFQTPGGTARRASQVVRRPAMHRRVRDLRSDGGAAPRWAHRNPARGEDHAARTDRRGLSPPSRSPDRASFSNSPINIAPVTKQGDHIALSDAVRWAAGPTLAQLPDGRYTVGIRPHHIGATVNSPGAVALDGKVLIAEISGSESVVHFAQGALTWLSQSHGVRAIEVGAMARFYMNVGECMYFDADGKRIAP